MKKIISLVLACVLLIGCVFALGSCTVLYAGTYENKGLLTTTTIELKMDGTVTYSIGSVSVVGEYEIEKNDSGDLVIDLDFEDGSIAEMIDGDYPFEKGDGYIEIAGVRYDKVKK